MLKEVNKGDLIELLSSKKRLVVLVYTNMCGTCEQAKVMLSIISETLNEHLFLKINANLNQDLIDDYNITSIPCFLLFKDGVLYNQFYAFHSVTYLFNKIKQINE